MNGLSFHSTSVHSTFEFAARLSQYGTSRQQVGLELKDHASSVWRHYCRSLFDKDNTLQRGKQSCRLYRHKAADGFSSSTTPAHPPPRRRRDEHGVSFMAMNPRPKRSSLRDWQSFSRSTKLEKSHKSTGLMLWSSRRWIR